jgi:ferredoxin-NADP reductase
LASAPHERFLAITVKEEPFLPGKTQYPPLLSPLLAQEVKPGRVLELSGFAGPYTLPKDLDERTSHVVHVVAGSGAVPNFALLKHALHSGFRAKHTFISSHKTWADALYRKQLEELQKQHSDRLQLVYTLTRESPRPEYGQHVFAGRMGTELLRRYVTDVDTCLVYVSGPAVTLWDRRAARDSGLPPSPRFLESTLSALVEMGVAGTRIKRESYG